MISYLAVYACLSALFLTRFPFVHSDESWLMSLSRDMMSAGSLGVTESVFNAKVRYAHAIKCIYHLLQQGCIALFGYNPFSARILSLAGTVVFLFLFYLLAKRITEKKRLSFALTVLLSLDCWLILISHLGRQEALLLALMTGMLYALFTDRVRCAAVLTGLAIGFHPNSFLLACIAGALLFVRALDRDKEDSFSRVRSVLRLLLPYIGIVLVFAVFFLALSFSFTPDFLRLYFSYGAADFSLDAPPSQRLLGLFGFFERLFLRQSGTYYLPETRVFLLSLALLAAGMTIACIVKKDRELRELLAGLLGLVAGLVIIARYNQMSLIFFFPFAYLLFGKALLLLPGGGGRREENDEREEGISRAAVIVLAAAFAITLPLSAMQIAPKLSASTYEDYENHLAALLPRDAKTIANLNTGFYFAQGALLDYRNLPYVMAEADGLSPVDTIARYVGENDVRYILYTAELDYLLSHRPYYNVIYGNIMFAEALKTYCETYCDREGSFTDLTYGTRVIALTGREEYAKVTVYRVRE